MSETGDKQQPQNPSPRWVHTLGGLWKAETYGIVEFLRVHPTCRGIVGILGVIVAIGAFVAWGFGAKIIGLGVSFLPLMIAGPWLLYVFTISGPNFEVRFPEREAELEREEAEKKFEQSKTVEDALNLDLIRLNEYYVINQSQSRSSFRWAVFSMLLGFGTIICGIWLFYFRGGQPDTFMASLSTAAGVVINLISALFLRLHSKKEDRSLHYYNQLSRLQHLSIAIQLVSAQQDPKAQQEARNLVIRALVSGMQPKSPKQTVTPTT